MEIEEQNYFDDFDECHKNGSVIQNMEQNQLFQQMDQQKGERRQKYLEQEQIRMNQVDHKLRNEDSRKQEIRNYAQQELNEWHSKMQENKNKQRQINQTKNLDYLESDQSSNPWNTIVQNIDLKEQDYQGSKDINRMKQAILGRKSDLEQ